MQIQSKPLHLPIPIPDVTIDTLGSKNPNPIHSPSRASNPTLPNPVCTLSKPQLIHPDECPQSSNPSLQKNLITAFTQSEKYQDQQIDYLQQKQSNLIHSILEQKQKIIELHNTSHSNISTWMSTMDIALPLFNSIIALYLGFSPIYSFSKIPAICTSLVGFAIAGLKMRDIALPSAVPTCYMTICNIYIAYINPKDTITQVANLLQMFPVISEFVSNIDHNSMSSDEIIAQKVIQTINRELTHVAGEISRAIQMISEKKNLFSTMNDYEYLQNRIAAVGAA